MQMLVWAVIAAAASMASAGVPLGDVLPPLRIKGDAWPPIRRSGDALPLPRPTGDTHGFRRPAEPPVIAGVLAIDTEEVWRK